MGLKYSEFLKKAIKARGWKAEDVANRINEKWNPKFQVTTSQVYSFLEGENEPRCGFAKAVESLFEFNLDPTFYGFTENKKPARENQ